MNKPRYLRVALLSASLLFAATMSQAAVSATGGEISFITNAGIIYAIHTFTNSGSFTITADSSVALLVVGGGGGGGLNGAGGGGGGGVIYEPTYAVEAGTYAVTVGVGGAAASGSSVPGSNGGDSKFGAVTAKGGGGGASRDGGGGGKTGGSGGGGGGSNVANKNTIAVAGSGTAGQGYKGGTGFASNSADAAGGGGGGAGGPGGDATTVVGGTGGPGKAYDISGSTVYYGGGGGGSVCGGGTHGNGGIGGGGNGGNVADSSGAPNSGGGGGGGRNAAPVAGYNNGGSGIVIVRYVSDISGPTLASAASVSDITTNSAWLVGSLVSTGHSATAVTAFWGTADGGDNTASWEHGALLGSALEPGNLTVNATNLLANTAYYFRFCASNEIATVWSDSGIFITGDIWIEKSGDTSKTLLVPGTFTVHRAASAIGGDLTVNYSIGGSATLETDYTLSPAGTLVIPQGETSARLVVTPLLDDHAEGDETVIITLQPGGYITGTPAVATMTIGDYNPLIAMPRATGGDITAYVEQGIAHAVHTFTASGSLSVEQGGKADILVIGGGGGGGLNGGGGGGGGGFIYTNSYPLVVGSHAITIGNGGASAVNQFNPASNGGDSKFGAITAKGGGGGASRDGGGGGKAGGSGGGGGGSNVGNKNTIAVAGSGTTGQGNKGGTGFAHNSGDAAGGGGGGAGGPGGNAAIVVGGAGGVGKASSITGSQLYYSGGGGGCVCGPGTAGTGGIGGGGDGGRAAKSQGLPNSGGGGGGQVGDTQKYPFGYGGSGVVIINYAMATPFFGPTLNATNISATTADLCATLAATGYTATAVTAYWGESDGGDDHDGWQNRTTLAAPQAAGTLAAPVSGLQPATTYFFRFSASNEAGRVWSAGDTFITGDVWVGKNADTSKATLMPGSFTIHRPATAVDTDLAVNFAIGGSAVYGVDYTLSVSGTVAIAAGDSSATILATPLFGYNTHADKTVTLTIEPGNYSIGSPASAAMAVADVRPRHWAKRMPLTFNGYTPPDGGAPLTNFPVLVKLDGTLPGFSYSRFLSPPCSDLRFTAADLQTPLDFEVEEWNTEATSYIWVKVPELTANTTIYAFWGRESCLPWPCQTNGAVWSAGYEGVWHMQHSSPTDATGKGNQGNGKNGVGTTDGLVGKSLSLNGTSHYVNCGNGLRMRTSDATLGIWFKTGNTEGRNFTLIGKNMAASAKRYGIYKTSGGFLRALFQGDDVNHVYMTADTPWQYSDDTWHYIAATYKRSGDMTLYVDGLQAIAPISISSQAGIDLNNGTTFFIGVYGDATGNAPSAGSYFPGALDEGRFAMKARSPEWVWAEYMTIASNNLFTAYAAAEAHTRPTTVLILR